MHGMRLFQSGHTYFHLCLNPALRQTQSVFQIEYTLLILDEPKNGLDPIGIAEMRMLIRRLSHECGKTILISSHQLSEMEQMVDWIGIIHEGRMLEECSYQQLEKNRHSYIRLVVKEPEQVFVYLRKTLSIKNIKRPEPSVIEIYDLKYGTLELNSRLFAAGFAVAEISK